MSCLEIFGDFLCQRFPFVSCVRVYAFCVSGFLLYHAFFSMLLKLLTYDAMIKGLERSLKLSYSFSLSLSYMWKITGLDFLGR